MQTAEKVWIKKNPCAKKCSSISCNSCSSSNSSRDKRIEWKSERKKKLATNVVLVTTTKAITKEVEKSAIMAKTSQWICRSDRHIKFKKKKKSTPTIAKNETNKKKKINNNNKNRQNTNNNNNNNNYCHK